jgi:hypothetical protein
MCGRVGKIVVGVGVLFLFIAGRLAAQRVLYCSPADDRFITRREVAGVAGDHYFTRIEKRKRGSRNQGSEEEAFEVYDARMNLVNTVASFTGSESALKEYFVSGSEHFDQLVLLAVGHGTSFFVRRYGPGGEGVDGGREVGSFPFQQGGNNFLLIRSEDRTKILLLGFEPVMDAPQTVHALLFDQDWRQLYYRVYEHPYFTQPLIQDDFISYPIEHYDNEPIKLGNDGQWLMVSPSRTNQDYLLFQFCGREKCVSYREIALPASGTMEDLSLSLDNGGGEALVGVVSRFHYSTLKNVQVVHYSLERQAIDFDSSYRFNTLGSGKVRNENLVKESFVAVPGRGFMLLKEYGRIFSDWYDEGIEGNLLDPSVLFADNAIPDLRTGFPVVRDGYAHYPVLGGPGNDRERGDLSLFYLPGLRGDSSWSGMISKRQTTEMNAPTLSYLVITIRDKLIFLYNSLFDNEDQYGSATVIDSRGNPMTDGGPVFWKFKITLDFQRARRISENEFAVPYANPERKGFAVIRF